MKGTIYLLEMYIDSNALFDNFTKILLTSCPQFDCFVPRTGDNLTRKDKNM